MTKTYKIIFKGLTITSLLCTSFITLAADIKTHSYSPTTYNSFSDIPSSLAIMIKKGMFQEQYISNVLSIVRESKLNRNIINLDGINNYKAQLTQKTINRQKSTLVVYDTDLDGFIDRQEIRKSIVTRRPKYKKIRYKKNFDKQFQSILNYDLDNDGKISYKEMGTLSQAKSKKALERSRVTKMHDFLRLDPNDSGTINVVELAILANKAFATIDKDMNTIISDKEYEIYYNSSSNWIVMDH